MTNPIDPYEISPSEGAGIGALLLARWREAVRNPGGAGAGAALVAAFFDMGKGDEHDAESTAVDVAAYLGHLAEREGVDFAGLCAAAEARGPAGGDMAAAELPAAEAIGRALVDLRDYCGETGLSFDDVARIAIGHVRQESWNAGAGPG